MSGLFDPLLKLGAWFDDLIEPGRWFDTSDPTGGETPPEPTYVYKGTRQPNAVYLGLRTKAQLFLGTGILWADAAAQSYSSTWTTNNTSGPFTPTGNGVASDLNLYVYGTTPTLNSGRLRLYPNDYLESEAFGVDFTDGTPKRLRISFKGIALTGQTTDHLLGDIFIWNTGRILFTTYWDGDRFRVGLQRDTTEEWINSDSDSMRALGTNQLYEVEWNDNIGGSGGTVTFYVDGVQMGSVKNTTIKPKIPNNAFLSVNASLGNASNSVNMEVEYVKIEYEI